MKVGLALSGGGARGFAHLGVLQALKEANIKVDVISGASAGSLAAAFHAYGYSPKETLEIFESTKILKLIWPAFSTTGLLSIQRSELIYDRYLSEDSFSHASLPLFVATTNLNKGRPEIFNSGSLKMALMASCCIPVIFDPVKIGEDEYVDGGIMNNLPTEVLLQEGCDVIIGVNVAPILPDRSLDGPKRMFERVSMLALSANVESSSRLCDLYLLPRELRNYGTFDFRKSRELYQIGYEHTKYELSMLEPDHKLKLLGAQS